MSPNLQDGTDSPSRKRSLEDYLDTKPAGAAEVAAKPSKLQLVTDVENLSSVLEIEKQKRQQQEQAQQAPQSPESPILLLPPDSPDSPLSEVHSPLSLLTDGGSSTPTRLSPSPNPTPSRPAGTSPQQLIISIDALPAHMANSTGTSAPGPPPAKRKKLTPAEREQKARADAARKQEKERQEAARKQEKERAEAAKKLERDEKNAAAEAKKKALAEEREKKRKQREEEEQRRADEKEKKRKEKEEEERKIQEAKEKKERNQLRLNSFFKTGGASTPKKASPFSLAAGPRASASPQAKGGAAAAESKFASPQKPSTTSEGAAAAVASAVPEISEYDRIFKPFFIKENVIMATSLYGMDDETKEAKSRILDEHISGARGSFVPPKPFNAAAAVDYFHLPCCQNRKPTLRGRKRPTVRKIMNMLSSDAYAGGYGAYGAADAQTRQALDLLRTVPMKYLFFREDVRPAYFGTVTSAPTQARLTKLARNPLAKTVLPLNYDYDSEAEWVDDGDGEDVDDLDDEEDLEPEEDEEMADFLDDSEDSLLLRPAFSGGMEPESTGICWEDERTTAPLPEMDSFRMEFILDHGGAIDPFSTQYWEVPASEPPATIVPAPNTSTTVMPPPPVPADAFAALLRAGDSTAGGSTAAAAAASSPSASAAALSTTTGKADAKKATGGVAPEFVDDVKKGILQYAKLSKLGIVEILSVELMGKCTKSQIKTSLDALAERTGTGQHKTWKLKG